MSTILYMLVNDISAFVWWLFIRMGRSDWEEERSPKNFTRNIFIFLVLFLIAVFISVNWNKK